MNWESNKLLSIFIDDQSKSNNRFCAAVFETQNGNFISIYSFIKY